MELNPLGCRASNCAPPPTGPRGAGWCFEKPCTVTPFPVLGPGGGAEPCEKPCRRQSACGGPRRRRCAAETWRALAGEAPGAEGLVSAGVSGLVWAVLPAPSQRPAAGLRNPGTRNRPGRRTERPREPGVKPPSRGRPSGPSCARPRLAPLGLTPTPPRLPPRRPAGGWQCRSNGHVSDPVGRADRRAHGGVRGPAAAASSLERAAPCRLLATEAGD